MNIKGLNPNLVHLDTRLRADGKDNVRTQNSSERDANGRRQQEEAPIKRTLTEEEFAEALQALKDNPAVKNNNFQIRVANHEGLRVVYVEDLSGQVIRRLSMADLWLVTRLKDRPTGKILDKAG